MDYIIIFVHKRVLSDHVAIQCTLIGQSLANDIFVLMSVLSDHVAIQCTLIGQSLANDILVQ